MLCRLTNIGTAKKAFGIVKTIAVDRAVQEGGEAEPLSAADERQLKLVQQHEDDITLKTHIDPNYAAGKAQKEQDKITAALILANTDNEKCLPVKT